MHAPRFVMVLVILVAAFAAAGDSIFDTDQGQPPPQPMSIDARDALSKYDAAAQAADDACVQAKIAADQKLVEGLNGAMTKATRAGNLKEANAIKAQIAVANQRMAAEQPPDPSGAGMVRRALYGPEGKETTDVTPAIKRCIKGNSIEFNNLKIPDVAPMRRKSLLIEGDYGGIPFELRVPEGALHLFSFGAPQKK